MKGVGKGSAAGDADNGLVNDRAASGAPAEEGNVTDMSFKE